MIAASSVGLVSENYFSVLGIKPLFGRTFSSNESNDRDAHFVAVVSENLWRLRFGSVAITSDPHLYLNGQSYSIVGVVTERAARFFNVVKVDVFVPAVMQGAIRGGHDSLDVRGNREFLVVGRLKTHVDIVQARAFEKSLTGYRGDTPSRGPIVVDRSR